MTNKTKQTQTSASKFSLHLLYFASLADTLGRPSETLTPNKNITSVAELRQYLQQHDSRWASAAQGATILCAVNQTVARDDTPLRNGDEVAFFPPVTGG
ncbi:molybdopterin converting factor subunit 1 [Teredinibacter waterburyi]|jgi:molybdopterin converting factor, subunit 1, non-archaeal|uniref:molybdopterin converting factor subunit 1 n=1 Tax=Teredinibacter waterburyi TaxID=1500538 RepID=UPI00165F00EB|nr:molybdopterin converting factor subunit 1 [Teredinibacter waterburyi]